MVQRKLSTREKRRNLLSDQATEILEESLDSKAINISAQLAQSLDSVRIELSGIRSAIRFVGYLIVASALFLAYILTRGPA
jgi:hypothetical protein